MSVGEKMSMAVHFVVDIVGLCGGVGGQTAQFGGSSVGYFEVWCEGVL